MDRRVLLVLIALVSVFLVGCKLVSNLPEETRYVPVAGTVLDQDGEGVRGVKIVFKLGETSQFTDEEGRWAHPKVKIGGRITPEKEGLKFDPPYRAIERNGSIEYNFQTTVGRIDDDADDGDEKPYDICGKVQDYDGDSIPSVTIIVEREDRLPIEMVTDKTGEFAFANLLGTVTVSAKKDRYSFNGPFDISGPRSNIVFVGVEAPPEIYDIGGRAVDAAGKGIPSVTITVELEDGEKLIAITTANGEYTRSGISGSATVTAAKDGYSFSGSIVVNGADSNVDFIGTEIVPEVYTIGGRAVDEMGQGIPSVTIIVELEDGEKLTAITTANGEYTRSGVSGSATVTAAKDGYSFSDPIVVNGPDSNVDFVGTKDMVEPVPYSIGGRVTDTVGDGVAQVIITFENPEGEIVETITDDSGFYQRDGLIGTITVTAYKKGWEFLPEERVVSEEDLALNFHGTPDIEPTYSVSGTILLSDEDDERDGDGVPSVLLKFEFLDEPHKEDLYTTTDNEGNWQKDGLTGTVKVTPTKRGFTFEPDEQIIDKGFQTVSFVAYKN